LHLKCFSRLHVSRQQAQWLERLLKNRFKEEHITDILIKILQSGWLKGSVLLFVFGFHTVTYQHAKPTDVSMNNHTLMTPRTFTNFSPFSASATCDD
jgi:hypothetical protein